MSNAEIPPKTLFVDTNAFKTEGYRFRKGQRLARIKDAISKDSLKVLISAIVDSEIKAHLREKAAELTKLQKGLIEEAGLLYGIDIYAEILKPLNAEALTSFLLQEFETFKKTGSVTVLNYEGVSVKTVCEQYFSERPPFIGRDKTAFPDAIAIAELNSYLASKPDDVAVITNDGGWIKALEGVDRVRIFPTFSNYLAEYDEYVSLMKNKEDFERYHDLIIEKGEAKIAAALQKHMENADYHVDPTEEDGEVLQVSEFEVYDISIKLIDMDLKTSEAKVFVTASVRFKADAKILDPELSVWDSEDKAYVFKEYREECYEQDFENLEFEAIIHLDKDEEEILEVNLVGETIDDSFTIEISNFYVD